MLFFVLFVLVPMGMGVVTSFFRYNMKGMTFTGPVSYTHLDVYKRQDYNWMNEIDGKLKYGGKEIVDSFNSIANVQGQMDWGLAYHPYPCPMTVSYTHLKRKYSSLHCKNFEGLLMTILRKKRN